MTTAPAMTLGEHLRRARERAEMSQAELAVRIGVSRPTLGKWERDHGLPDVRQFVQIVEATRAVWLLDVVGLLDPLGEPIIRE